MDHVWTGEGRHFPRASAPCRNRPAAPWRGPPAPASNAPELPSWVLLHEIAHALTCDVDGNGLNHGPYFVGAYLHLLVRYARLDRSLLEATLAAAGIGWTSAARV